MDSFWTTAGFGCCWTVMVDMSLLHGVKENSALGLARKSPFDFPGPRVMCTWAVCSSEWYSQDVNRGVDFQNPDEKQASVDEFRYLEVSFKRNGKRECKLGSCSGASPALLQALCQTVVAKRQLTCKAKLLILQSDFSTMIRSLTKRIRSQIQVVKMRFLDWGAGLTFCFWYRGFWEDFSIIFSNDWEELVEKFLALTGLSFLYPFSFDLIQMWPYGR